MKILLSAVGTRGDIQPFIALGQGLQAAGQQVALCTAEGYRAFVEGNGLDYAHMSNEFLEVMQSQEGQAATEGGGNALAIYKKMPAIMRRAFEDEWQVAQAFQPDAMIFHPKMLGSYHVAEKLQIPAWLVLPLPLLTPTSAFPIPILSNVRLGKRFNRFSYQLSRLATVMYGGVTNDFRREILGLPPQSRFADTTVKANGEPLPVLYAYSRHLVPTPPDFPAHVHVTGYWFLDRQPDWQPPADLTRFLAAGPPPVYIGFGSMSGTTGAKRAQIVIDALRQTGQRGLLASGWGGLHATDLPDNIMLIDAAPHDWLLPQVAAVVHHGGAGTTAAGLRAGKPTVICPFIADQPFWGKVVYARGVGTKPIPQKQLTVEGLAAAITTAVSDRAMQQRAAELGVQLRAEDGVGCAVRLINAALTNQSR